MTTTTTTTSPSSTQKLTSNNLLHHFSIKSSSSMKLKTLMHTIIFSHICRMVRALSKAKSIVANILKDIDLLDHLLHFKKGSNKHYYKHHHHKVKVYGSFRLHYNWCSASSHVLPEPESSSLDKFSPSQFYYDSNWNSKVSNGAESSFGLSDYLHWLEETPDHVKSTEHELNGIDKLADLFIATCHAKFRLEKQESYRRFQEMMARSM